MDYLRPRHSCIHAHRRGKRAAECRAECDALLGTNALVGKPRSRQRWFFHGLVWRLLAAVPTSEFDALTPVQAAQLKFAVEDKLRRYYLRPGVSPTMVFPLVHESELERDGVGEVAE